MIKYFLGFVHSFLPLDKYYLSCICGRNMIRIEYYFLEYNKFSPSVAISNYFFRALNTTGIDTG